MAKSKVADSRVRISVTPTEEILKRVDDLSVRLGMSRSATCTMLIATGLESYDALLRLPEEKLRVVVSALNQE